MIPNNKDCVMADQINANNLFLNQTMIFAGWGDVTVIYIYFTIN